jgi:hypothetical protein
MRTHFSFSSFSSFCSSLALSYRKRENLLQARKLWYYFADLGIIWYLFAAAAFIFKSLTT